MISKYITLGLLSKKPNPLILNGMARFLIVRDRLEPADVIIVLAGDSNGERVAAGVKLYKQGYANKLLMSGGPLAWKLTYAEWMKEQAMALGVDPKDVILEVDSRSTFENAKLTLPIVRELQAKTVIMVTSPPHTRRAKRVFRNAYSKEKIKVISCPVENSAFQLAGWWKRHEDTQFVVREYISMFYYILRRY